MNDTFGHDRGDHVLRQVAQAIRGVFRPTDIIARSGGDEFAVFITGIPSQELAIAKADDLCRALRSIGTAEEGLSLSCSVGVAIFPEHGTTFSELYHTSDLALYQAKREGKDRSCLFGIESVTHSMEKSVDREWLFSQIEEEVYLSTIDNHTLLFANEALLRRTGHTQLTAKGLCYEVLHQRAIPCEECQGMVMKQVHTSTWLRKDKKIDTLFLVREKVLLMKGEWVKLSVSTPIPPNLRPSTWEAFRSSTP